MPWRWWRFVVAAWWDSRWRMEMNSRCSMSCLKLCTKALEKRFFALSSYAPLLGASLLSAWRAHVLHEIFMRATGSLFLAPFKSGQAWKGYPW